MPPLRFPEFEGEWKLSTIGDECDILCGYAFDGDDILEKSGDVLLMRGINIAEGYLRHSEDLDRFYSGPKEKLSKYVVRTGDVVMGMDGSKVGRNAAIVTPKEDGAYLVQRVCRLRSKKTNVRLLIQYINNPKYYKYVDAIKTASAIPHISQTDIQRYRVYLPASKQEQDKIYNLLSFIDERIATQTRIIEDLEQLKSAISLFIFDSVSMPTMPLSSFMKKGKAGGTPTSTNKDYYGGDIPFLSINDITEQGKYVNYTEKKITPAGIDNSSAWIVPQGSLIFSMYASVGLVAINAIPLATSQAMFAMILKNPRLTNFLYYFLSYFRYRHIYKYLETGTQSNINAEIVRSIPVPNLSVDNCINIGKILSLIDDKLSVEKTTFKLLLMQKQFLLQKMFI